jgi:serine protease AprX
VFFADKGFTCEDDQRSAMDQYASRLLPRARSRRQRAQGRAINISDLPVFQPYIDGMLQLGATLRINSRWLNGITVEVSDDAIPRILQLPYVRTVEPVATHRRRWHEQKKLRPASDPRVRGDQQLAPNIQHPEYGMSATQIQQIHADVLHDKGYHGEGITIALLDTGFDLSHEALQRVDVRAEYDFVNGDGVTSDNPPEDDIGQDDHGTEVLSIIAGNSPGNLIGVAYAAEYLLAKTERVSCKGTMFEQEIEEDWWVAGLEWAELNGADVVTSSLGYSDWYSYSDMDGATAKTTIAADIAVQKGVVVVVSAGNEGKSRHWPYISAPADGFDVIAVGAVNGRGELASFSSIGPTYDGRIKPDVVAMGDDTHVVDPNSTSGYRKADGTSMATPLVAGTAALLLQALPGLDGPKDLAKLLKYTATHSLSPDNRYGWGIIDAQTALRCGTSPLLMEELSDWDPTGAISHAHRVIVYPNPVRRGSSIGRLNIHSPESMESIRIYSLSGLLIYERQDMGSARFSIWDLKNEHGQEVATGIYICVIEDSAGSIDVRKIAVID